MWKEKEERKKMTSFAQMRGKVRELKDKQTNQLYKSLKRRITDKDDTLTA